MNDSFKPQTAFEGYIKAQTEQLFKQMESTNDDITIFKSDITKQLSTINEKLSGIKGWIAGISIVFGLGGGIIAVIVREMIK